MKTHFKSRVFVGSSKHAKEQLYAVQELLSDSADIVPWTQANFELTKSTLSSIERELRKSDFGIFIFSPDDKLLTGGEERFTTRDNVILELGLFMGHLGRDRVFILCPDKLEAFKIPSDLLGITFAMYAASADDIKIELGKAVTGIRRAIKQHGIKEENYRLKRRIVNVPERGSTKYIDITADAALYVADYRHEYPKELRRRIIAGEMVPTKYLYRTEQGSIHWLAICKRGKYNFYKDSLSLLRSNVAALVSHCVNTLGTKEIDIVSLGSGNGVKDNILLREFSKGLSRSEYIYYYPVDISDTLIEEAVRNSLGKGIDKSKIRLKALLADFMKLSAVQGYYEERPANNLFSILGNTLGNTEETDIVSSVADGMLPGDLVLLEVDTSEANDQDSFLRDQDYMMHDFTPLATLGVEFDAKQIVYKKVLEISHVPDTESILSTYKEASIPGEKKPVNDVNLSVVHHYKSESLKEFVEEKMNVETIWESDVNGVGLLLAQREE